MRRSRVLAAAVVLGLAAAALPFATASPKKLLVVTVTKGFRHDSIPTAERVVAQLGLESGSYVVEYARTDEDLAAKATVQALEGYDGVVFASTTGDLPLPEREDFLDWIERGHAFIGIHAATDTFPGFPGYLDMIGGQFDKHGPQVEVQVLVQDAAHPATKQLDKSFKVFDEIYQFKNFERGRVRVLLALDRHPNEGTPGFYPLAWSRNPAKGRVFYTALGHREDVLESPWFKKHLLGGIRWALKQE